MNGNLRGHDGRSPTRAIYDRVMHCRGKVLEDQDVMFVIVCLRKIELQCPYCKERCRILDGDKS